MFTSAAETVPSEFSWTLMLIRTVPEMVDRAFSETSGSTFRTIVGAVKLVTDTACFMEVAAGAGFAGAGADDEAVVIALPSFALAGAPEVSFVVLADFAEAADFSLAGGEVEEAVLETIGVEAEAGAFAERSNNFGTNRMASTIAAAPATKASLFDRCAANFCIATRRGPPTLAFT